MMAVEKGNSFSLNEDSQMSSFRTCRLSDYYCAEMSNEQLRSQKLS